MSLYDFYLESRNVQNSYDRLFDLIIYDKIKSVLPPFLSRHVLALESASKDRWLGGRGLVDALDAFVANMSSDTRTKAVDAAGNNNALNCGNNRPRTAVLRSADSSEDKVNKVPSTNPRTVVLVCND